MILRSRLGGKQALIKIKAFREFSEVLALNAEMNLIQHSRQFRSFLQRRHLAVLMLCAISSSVADACPWCATNPAMKPTVFEGDPDSGGKFFGATPAPERVKRYFIAAEPEIWNFLPDGEDPVMKSQIQAHILNKSVFGKSRFHRYTDETFTTRVLPDDRLGIMGPVMRGVTGDFIVVTLLNRLTTPVSLHPHGVRYDKDSEGSSYFPGRGMGASIAPNARYTYVWHLDELSAPGANEPSSKPWLYHSHVAGDEEINAGLCGFIIVTDPKRAKPDGTPADVDREMAILLQNYDQSGMSEAQEYANLKAKDGIYPDGSSAPPPETWAEIQEKKELTMRHAINGRIFGNLKGLEMKEGERVRWYLFEVGNEADVHTAHWHGSRLRDTSGRSTDVVELMPGTMKVADMVADNPGDWMIHCHVGEHMMEGMYGNYTVYPKNSPANLERAFFATADNRESIEWKAADGCLKTSEFDFKITCKVTAYDNLSSWTTLLGLVVGETKASIRLDHSGAGKDNGAEFKVLNLDPTGVVRGHSIELEIHLSGPQWRDAFRTATGSKVCVPIELTVNEAPHHSRIPLEIIGQSIRLQR